MQANAGAKVMDAEARLAEFELAEVIVALRLPPAWGGGAAAGAGGAGAGGGLGKSNKNRTRLGGGWLLGSRKA